MSTLLGPSTSSVGMASTSSSTSASAIASTSTPFNTVELSGKVLGTFKPAKVYTDSVAPGEQVTSLSIDDRGEHIVTASSDESLHVYSCASGKHLKQTFSKKYGVQLARFTHSSSSVLYASTKLDETIRYHSLHDNKFLQYFRGHSGRVVSLQMSPLDDTFLSGAVDDSVRLWDLRTPKSQGHLHLKGHPVVAYDATGKVFAVAINERAVILLYDIRKFDQDPFLTIDVDDTQALSQISMPPRIPVITGLQFNDAGGHLLASTSSDVHYIINSYTGELLHRLVGHDGLERASGTPIGMVPEAGISGQEACWTADGRFVLSGSATGKVHIWEVPDATASAQELAAAASARRATAPHSMAAPNLYSTTALEGHEGPARCVAFNHKYAELITAGSQFAMWLPEPPSDI